MQDHILKERFDCSRMCGFSNYYDLVTEFRPFERWIGPRNDGPRSSYLPNGVGGSPFGTWESMLIERGNSEEDGDMISVVTRGQHGQVTL